jgi:hypothetical protein
MAEKMFSARAKMAVLKKKKWRRLVHHFQSSQVHFVPACQCIKKEKKKKNSNFF